MRESLPTADAVVVAGPLRCREVHITGEMNEKPRSGRGFF